MEDHPPQTSSQVSEAEINRRTNEREAKLRDLLVTDYEHAKETGLIDAFYYDPVTGEDAIMHILAGDSRQDDNGNSVYEGFHHEPTGEMIWGQDPETGEPQTRVDREAVSSSPSQKRRKYREFPFEPYLGKVDINGVPKLRVGEPKKEGGLDRIDNSMFPKEYDALAVMKSIKQALDSRDKSKDETSDKNERPTLINKHAFAPMLDGESSYQVLLVIDEETGKVVTAMPTPKSVGIMRLSREAIRRHLGLDF